MNDRKSTSPSDEDLARRFQHDPASEAGRAAASELFERYWDRVYLWCFRRIGEHEAARDVAQDILISAYQALDRFEGRSLYSSWLFTIMRHRCFRVLRRPGLIYQDEVEVDRTPGATKEMDSILVEQEEEQEALDMVREILDPEEQTALWLRSFELLPVDEITRLLRIGSSSGARGVFQSARRKLRTALEKLAARREEHPS